MADYIQRQCAAYAELLDLKEVISETKKVDDFLKNITDPRLKTVKENVIALPLKASNFTVAHQFVQTVHSSMAQQDKSDRLVSTSETDAFGGGRGGGRGHRQGQGRGRGRGRGARRNGGRTPAGNSAGNKVLSLNSSNTYSHANWSKLTTAQQEKVQLLRQMSRKAKVDARIVSAAKATMGCVSEESVIPTYAGSQFGRGDHNKKAKADL